MEVFWSVGTEKSMPDCGLVEFRIRTGTFLWQSSPCLKISADLSECRFIEVPD